MQTLMLKQVLLKQKEKKFIWVNIGFFVFFMAIYTLLDSFNLSYQDMALEHGIFLPIANVLLNIIMSVISTLMITFTSAQFVFAGKESKASNMSFVSVLFGVLTYGCTPCVISFFAAIGISFSVAILPFAGLPYKFISLALLIGGFLWIIFRLKKSYCKVDLTAKDDPTIRLK